MRIAAVIDPVDAAREKIVRATGASGFPSIEALLASPTGSEVRGAIIATPPNARLPIVGALLERGIGVLVEKPLAHTLAYRDSLNPTPRAKPHGAQALQLFMVVDDENAIDPREARFVGNFTSNPMTVTYAGRDRGKQATFFARWCGRRNQVGQWSLPVSMTIAA